MQTKTVISKTLLVLILLVLAVSIKTTSDGLSIFGFTIPGLCLFKTVLHIDCPVCGMTRSVTSAAHFRFAESFNFHPLGVPFLAGVVLYGMYLMFAKSPLIPLFQRGRRYFPPLNNNFPLIPTLLTRGSRKAGALQRGVRGDFEIDSQSVGAAHPTSDSKELAVYRGMSKLFSAALLLVWAYKIIKEVSLWH